MIGCYVLDGHEAVPEPNWMRWAMWMEEADRTVAWTAQEGFDVSTVFLGLDHALDGGPPQLFETMIFKRGEFKDSGCWRYSTWIEAERGHREAVRQVFAMNARIARMETNDG